MPPVGGSRTSAPLSLASSSRIRALDEPLPLLGGVILGVLGEVAVGPRLGDGLDDAVALHALELVELLLEAGVTFPGHRGPWHHGSFPRARSVGGAGGRRPSGHCTTPLVQ